MHRICLARNKGIYVQAPNSYISVPFTVYKNTVCKSNFSGTTGCFFFFFSTNVRKGGKGYKTFSIPVVFHKAAVHSHNCQAPRTPGVFQETLITGHWGGETCEHPRQDWLCAWARRVLFEGGVRLACFLLMLQEEVCTSQNYSKESKTPRT